MPKIFISYRRSDSINVAKEMYAYLERRFGPGSVFMDIDSMLGGLDFRLQLHDAISQCDAVLVVIGPTWLKSQGIRHLFRLFRPRLYRRKDFVRIEIETALDRRKPTFPVLVLGASMPSAGQLPSSLQEFSFRQAITVRPEPDFVHDMERLASEVELLATKGKPTPVASVARGKTLPRARRISDAPRIPPGSEPKPVSPETLRRYRTGNNPAIGFNLVSWFNFGTKGPAVWENAVLDLYNHGFRSVSIIPVRYVDPVTGVISGGHKSPEIAHLAAGIDKARSLGMTVTVNPFIEPQDFPDWRGNLQFTGDAATEFFNQYRSYLSEVASVAEANGVNRMTIGSELESLVRNPKFHQHWGFLIDATRASFSGLLGYAANWDGYDDQNLLSAVWEHRGIDFIGINAFFPLATKAEADASGPYPDEQFISVVQGNWETAVAEVLEFSSALRGGQGLPVVFSEHGLVPHNRTTVAPFSSEFVQSQPPEPDEQVAGYDALLRATRGLGLWLHEITFWHWGMPGGEGSAWYTHPNNSLSRRASEFLADYVASAHRAD